MSVGKHAVGRRPLGKLALLLALAMVVSAFAVGPLAGAGDKVDVCHYDADAGLYFKINISENAFQSHVDNHGDASPGEEVPGNTGYEFGADCTVDLIFVPFLVTAVGVPGNTITPTVGPTLTNGVQYELRVTGMYKFVDWPSDDPFSGYADAQCSNRIAGFGGPGWVPGDDLPSPWENYLEVNYGDFSTIDWTPGTCEETTHAYTASVAGDGTAISFVIHDNSYVDNSVGNISVAIWQMTPTP